MNSTNNIPLCVDLDGTLLKTDTLYELLACVLKQQPWLLFVLPFWLMRGKHVLKRELSHRCQLNAAILPINGEFLNFLRAEHARGRSLLLATGAYYDVAKAIADHYGFFDGVLATNEKQNLTGARKAALLVEKFGEKGFDYAGNDTVDIPVWERARNSYLVNATPATKASVSRQFHFSEVMDLQKKLSFKQMMKAIRLHQWAKNTLIFVPLLAAHQFMDITRLTDTMLAFLAFGCCASFSYIINDIGDLEADRLHHSKYKRPFASADISIPAGLLLALFLISATLFLVFFLPNGFIYSLLIYFMITNMYTLRLKYVPILDVAILAGLYTLRVVAGGLAADVPTSFWLLAFSGFVFFSLAIVKRVSELLGIETPDEKAVVCRGYWTSDIPVLLGLGASSALIAVLVLALYINSPDIVQLYSSPRYLWLLCPIIALWLGRVWLITGRGQMHDDPVVFALRDRISWLLFGVAGMCLVIGAQL
jgi:4-hydroxybenzoate polyprenyltransferase